MALNADDAVDAAAEKTKKEQERDALTAYIATLTEKLANDAFVANAPADVVDAQRTKLADARAKEQELTAAIDRLQRLL